MVSTTGIVVSIIPEWRFPNAGQVVSPEPEYSTMFSLAMASPEVVYSFYENQPMSIDMLYSIVYYAFKSKAPKPNKIKKICELLNSYTSRTLHELDEAFF